MKYNSLVRKQKKMEKNAKIIGRLPKRSDSGPVMKFTHATPKRYLEIVYWVVL